MRRSGRIVRFGVGPRRPSSQRPLPAAARRCSAEPVVRRRGRLRGRLSVGPRRAQRHSGGRPRAVGANRSSASPLALGPRPSLERPTSSAQLAHVWEARRGSAPGEFSGTPMGGVSSVRNFVPPPRQGVGGCARLDHMASRGNHSRKSKFAQSCTLGRTLIGSLLHTRFRIAVPSASRISSGCHGVQLRAMTTC